MSKLTVEQIVGQANELYLHTIKKKLFGSIYTKLLDEFKADAEKTVKDEVDRLVNMHIDYWTDLAHIENNVKVVIDWRSK